MRKYVFADEAGDFEFARKQNVSRFFIICTITLSDCDIGHKLLDLRRELAWNNQPIGDYFHASEETQSIRDEVFKLIQAHDMRIDATIMEKCKAQPHVRADNARFYQYGWYFHFKHVAPKILVRDNTQILVTAASLGTKRIKAAFKATINDVMQQVAGKNKWIMSFCPAAADPCLQIADYCAWAIQRKWERGDARSYDLIKDKIKREYDLWSAGTTEYY